MMARTWMVGSTYGRIGSEIVGASVVEVVETSVTSRTRSRRNKSAKAGKQRCKVIFQYSKMVQRTKSEGTASRVVTAPVYGVYFDYTGKRKKGGGSGGN
jgi:hypothetical protein